MYGDVRKSCRKNRWKEAFMNFSKTQGMNDTNHPSNRHSDEEKYLEKVEKWYKNPSKIVLTTVRSNYGRWKRIAFLWATEDTHRHFCFGRKGQEKGLGRATKPETSRDWRGAQKSGSFALQKWRTIEVRGAARELFQRLPRSPLTTIKMLVSRLLKILH